MVKEFETHDLWGRTRHNELMDAQKIVTCRESPINSCTRSTINIQNKPETKEKTAKPAIKSSNHLTTTLLCKIIYPIRVSLQTLHFGSCEDRINDKTRLFYTEQTKDT